MTLLQRFRGSKGGRVAAVDAIDGRTRWSRKLPSRSESSPIVDSGRVYFGSEDGTVYSLRTSDGQVRWRMKADGAVKGALALADGKLFFGDYGGKVHAIRQSDGGKVWEKGSGGGVLGIGGGNFYSSAAVAYGRVYIGSTSGAVYSFSAKNGALAWRHSTGGYVYASPAVGPGPGGRPTVFIGSYDGRFYALDARVGQVALDPAPGPQDLRVGEPHRRPRLRLRPGDEVVVGAGCRDRRDGLEDRPRRLQPGYLRRPADLLQRLLVALRARSRRDPLRPAQEALDPDGDARVREVALRLADRVLAVVEDRRRQRGVRAGAQRVGEVLEGPGAARGDHRARRRRPPPRSVRSRS